jgi:uncharacterized membrane-anchored protein YjiN (DUF445 family)
MRNILKIKDNYAVKDEMSLEDKENSVYLSNYLKNKRMKVIATSLLVIMTIIYAISKYYSNKIYGMKLLCAFSEASMIGALADWFAVVAIFRHPLGLSFIPHTAIIKNNKKRIGESLSHFVVSNFFTEEIIMSKISNYDLSEEVLMFIRKNENELTGKISDTLKNGILNLMQSEGLDKNLKRSIISKSEDIMFCPMLGSVLDIIVISDKHIPVIKDVLENIYNKAKKDKNKTMEFLKGINSKLTMPIIGDMVYKSILESIEKQINSIGKDNNAEINKLLNRGIPSFIEKLKTDQEIISKGELIKAQIIKSPEFENLLNELLIYVKKVFVDYFDNKDENDTNNDKIIKIMKTMLDGMYNNDQLKEKIDSWLKNCIVGLFNRFRGKITKLIYDTVDNWELDEMVDKLEVQVGGDLQYIRINGTIIGGIAGLVIYLLTNLVV